MRARFQSKCPRCHKAIHEGDEILKRSGDQQYSHATCPVEYEVKVEAGSITPKWIDVPDIPEELFNMKGMHLDNEGHIVKVDPSTSYDDLMAYDRELRQKTGKGVWDSEAMQHQFYDENPFLGVLSERERMEKLYGKRVTIPMNARTDTPKDQIKGLRREADRLEAVAKRHKREAKARAKAAKVEARRIEAAKATLEAIATDRKARKEDRVEAARILLDRGI